MNNEKWRILIAFLLIVFVILSGMLIMKFLKENGECEINPLIYGAKQLKDKGFDLTCVCGVVNEKDPQDKYINFYFNSEGIDEAFPRPF